MKHVPYRSLALLSLVSVLGGCQDYGYSEINTVDRFQQSRRNAVDLLVVIDNSCSMVEEQDNVARNFDALISTFEAANVEWQLAVTTTDTEVERYRGLLMGGDDEIIVRGPFGELDQVKWDRRWAFTAGTSLQVDPGKSNDSFSNYCNSTSTFGSSMGTPGAWNPGCDGSAAEVPPVIADEGPRAPKFGDLEVTEIMAASAGQDSLCEWFELTNLTDDTLDLTGVNISDIGRNSATIPDGTTAAPYQAVVIGRSTDRAQNCDTPVDVGFAEGMILAQDIRVIGPDTPDGGEIFEELIAQGTIGSGIEQGLEAGRLVFEEPFWSESNQATGFLRGDARDPDDETLEPANFSVLFVSDEEDLSPLPAHEYVRYFSDLKGQRAYRDRSVVNLSAVIGKDPPPREDLPACESDQGVAAYGEKYIAAVNEAEGLIESICEPDFAPIISKLGLTLSGLSLDFELSEYPQLDTMKIQLYANEETESLVGELQCGVDFTYVADGNLLHFDEAQVPPSEYYVTATYLVSSVPNTADMGCGSPE